MEVVMSGFEVQRTHLKESAHTDPDYRQFTWFGATPADALATLAQPRWEKESDLVP